MKKTFLQRYLLGSNFIFLGKCMVFKKMAKGNSFLTKKLAKRRILTELTKIKFWKKCSDYDFCNEHEEFQVRVSNKDTSSGFRQSHD